MERAWRFYWRFNFASAVQPDANSTTPSLSEICDELCKRFLPERIRVVQIHPRQDGKDGKLLTQSEIDQLRKLGVEVVTIDGRRPANPNRDANGLFLADYFDFT
jgi:hypothetical protein